MCVCVSVCVCVFVGIGVSAKTKVHAGKLMVIYIIEGDAGRRRGKTTDGKMKG